jgi:hypothetical protein
VFACIVCIVCSLGEDGDVVMRTIGLVLATSAFPVYIPYHS